MGQASTAGDEQLPHPPGPPFPEQLSSTLGPTMLRSSSSWRDKFGALGRVAAPALLFLALGCGVAFLVWFSGRAALFPYPLDYVEGPVLDQALRLARGVSIYKIADATPPWTVGNYAPLYPSLLAPLTLVFGPAYWYGRLLSLLSIVVCAYLAGSIIRRLTGDRLAAAVTALLLPMIPSIGLTAPLTRVDNLALACSLSGLWCVFRWPNRRFGLLASVVLLAAAIYTKQTYAAVAPLTAFVWLLGESRRRAGAFAAILATVIVCAGIVLNAVTAGGFWFNVVAANIGVFSWASVGSYAVLTVTSLPVLVASGVACVVIGVNARDRAARSISCYLLGAMVVSLTVGKSGSSVSYLMELGVALCLALGMLLAWLRQHARARQVIISVIATQVFAMVALQDSIYGYAIDRLNSPQADARLMQIVQSADGPILADEELGMLPLLNRPIELEPFAMTQLVMAGRWDQTPLLDAIESQSYALILIYRLDSETPFTDEMVAVIERNYQVQSKVARPVGATFVYHPRR